MKDKEIKLLWGRSGGRCAFQECKEELSEEDVVLGEQAHIIARSEDGPRGESDLDVVARNKYENLILLCSHHHTLIDKMPRKYPVEVLQKMKTSHEKWVAERLSKGVAWETKLAQVHYLNIPRLSILFAMRGYRLSSELDVEIVGDLHDLGGMPLIRIMQGFSQAINDLKPIALDLTEVSDINDDCIGAIISFDENFRTKGYSSYSGSISGDVDKDPHVYKKSGKIKWILPIDPKWITTSTAQSVFCSGNARFAGLAMIKTIEGNAVVCTPLVLGTRESEWGF
ncbi:MAG: HNH endonuclease [Candidatus Thiodiazotropha taylori]|nr:HNH endonuclease [Candidatus Thiodiazotropha taylori]